MKKTLDILNQYVVSFVASKSGILWFTLALLIGLFVYLRSKNNHQKKRLEICLKPLMKYTKPISFERLKAEAQMLWEKALSNAVFQDAVTTLLIREFIKVKNTEGREGVVITDLGKAYLSKRV